MPLIQANLSSDIKNVFKNMKDKAHEEGFNGDLEFAKGLAKAFKDFGESGSISTTDSGAVSSGNFNGSGTGSLSLDDSDSFSTLLNATQEMSQNGKDDTYLAGEIQKSLEDMFDAEDIVNTIVNGSITPPPPALVPIAVVGAKGKGKLKCNFTSVKAGLSAFFSTMTGVSASDDLFAEQLALLVYSAVSAGSVSTDDEGMILGAKGQGTIA